jgi:DNA (cytosine-5)-methyltransferase 1
LTGNPYGDHESREGLLVPVTPLLEVGARTNGDGKRDGDGIGKEGDPMYTLQAGKQHGVAYDLRGREGGSQLEEPHHTANICASSGGSSRSYVAMGFYEKGDGGDAIKQLSPPLRAGKGSSTMAIQLGMEQQNYLAGSAVRRLTPVECERLQGFPDDYTAIPWRKKSTADCPDGPRYKALGNSMAVSVMRWIGERIQAVGTLR